MNGRHLILLLVCVLPAVFMGCGKHGNGSHDDGEALLRNAETLYSAGDVTAALDSARAAASAFVRAGEEGRAGDAEKTAADIERDCGLFDEALAHYASALLRYRGVGDRIAALQMQIDIAGVYLSLGDQESAFQKLDEQFRLAEATGNDEDATGLGKALLPVARAVRRTESEAHTTAVLEQIAGRRSDARLAAWLLDEKGLAKLHAGDATGAASSFAEALSSADGVHDSLQAIRCLRNLAHANELNGKFADAMSAYTAALQRSDVVTGGTEIREELLFRVGNAMVRASRRAEAIRFFESARQSAEQRHDVLAQAYAFLQLSHCQRGTAPATAVAPARTAIGLLHDAASARVLAYAHGTLGQALLASNLPAEASAEFHTAVEYEENNTSVHDGETPYDDCERAALGTAVAPWHDQLIDLLLKLQRREEAFSVALRRSACGVRAALNGVTPSTRRPAVDSLIGLWRWARVRANGIEARQDLALMSPGNMAQRAAVLHEGLIRCREEQTALAGAVIAQDPALAPFLMLRVPDGPAFLQSIPKTSTLIMYGTTPASLHAFIIARGMLSVSVVTIERGRLAEQCASYIQAMARLGLVSDSTAVKQLMSGESALVASGLQLYDVFIRPVEHALSGSQQILLVPPDDLPFVPLHALRRGEAASSALIERCPVAYVVPSWLQPAVADAVPKDIVAFGHGGSSGRDAEYELRDVRLFSKDARFYHDEQATLPALCAEHGDMLHLGVNLLWDGDRPGNSTIVLPDPQTGVTRNLPAGVLCGVGDFPTSFAFTYGNDAARGGARLPLLLFGAGVREVITNGIPTGRKGNKTFSEALYTAILSGKTLPAAYREATIDVMHRHDVVIPFWESYVLWTR